MKPSIFLNDVLTKGAILGGVMLLSNIVETSMFYYGGNIMWMLLFLVEWIVAISLYCYLIYRFTRNYSNLVISQRPELPYFTYGNGLSYTILVSMLAGVVVAIGGHIFMHYIIGYENFIDHYINLIYAFVAQSGASIQGLETMLADVVAQLESQGEPSLLTNLISGVWSYLISGTIVGLIVAAFTKRDIQMFNNK